MEVNIRYFSEPQKDIFTYVAVADFLVNAITHFVMRKKLGTGGLKMARWKVYEQEHAPQCTSCGMWAPFARYRRGNGINARDIADYCPNCGAKMRGIDECMTCEYAENGEWQDNGICFACRGNPWIFGKQHNERILRRSDNG